MGERRSGELSFRKSKRRLREEVERRAIDRAVFFSFPHSLGLSLVIAAESTEPLQQ